VSVEGCVWGGGGGVEGQEECWDVRRAYDAWKNSNGGVREGGGAGRLAEAGQGPGLWYLPCEDKLMGVFEWDTAEAPLVAQPGG
jgi:hypothetical protein